MWALAGKCACLHVCANTFLDSLHHAKASHKSFGQKGNKMSAQRPSDIIFKLRFKSRIEFTDYTYKDKILRLP